MEISDAVAEFLRVDDSIEEYSGSHSYRALSVESAVCLSALMSCSRSGSGLQSLLCRCCGDRLRRSSCLVRFEEIDDIRLSSLFEVDELFQSALTHKVTQFLSVHALVVNRLCTRMLHKEFHDLAPAHLFEVNKMLKSEATHLFAQLATAHVLIVRLYGIAGFE